MLSIRNASMGFGSQQLFTPVSVDVRRGRSCCSRHPVVAVNRPCWPGSAAAPARIAGNGGDQPQWPQAQPLATEDRRIGIMFQDALLFPHLTVGDNLAFGLSPGGSIERRDKIAAALAAIGMAGWKTVTQQHFPAARRHGRH